MKGVGGGIEKVPVKGVTYYLNDPKVKYDNILTNLCTRAQMCG